MIYIYLVEDEEHEPQYVRLGHVLDESKTACPHDEEILGSSDVHWSGWTRYGASEIAERSSTVPQWSVAGQEPEPPSQGIYIDALRKRKI